MDDPIAKTMEWYGRVPKFTRLYLTVATILSLLTTTGILAYDSLIFSRQSVQNESRQAWRGILSVFYHFDISLSLVIMLYISCYFFSRLEKHYQTRYGDFIIMVVYNLIGTCVFGWLLHLPFLAESFLTAHIIRYCYDKPSETINLFFGLTMESTYFPYVYVGFSVLMGKSFLLLVVGIVVAVTHIFLTDIISRNYGVQLLRAPRFPQGNP